jgi:flagellar basal-body rod protein FlgB
VRIFDRTLGLLERALDARLLRHNVLAGNLANANTPGYTPRDVDFDAAMRERLPAPDGAPSAAPDTSPSRDAVDLVSYRPAAAMASLAGDIPLFAAGQDDPGSVGSPVVVKPAAGTGAGLDGNSVDVDRALTAVAENAIQYDAAARAVQKKLAILRYAASDGTS